MMSLTLPRHSFHRRQFLAPPMAAVAALLTVALVSEQTAANPWVPIANPVAPYLGPAVPPANRVPGKEYSDVRDRNVIPAADPEQVVAWDGLGGVRDAFDYSGSRLAYPGADIDIEVDGIANQGDAAFQALRDNKAALLFSVETDPRVMFSKATGYPGAVAGSGVWAGPLDIDAMNPPLDTDGLEVWGPDQLDDADRYSLAGDPFVIFPVAALKVAIWSYDKTTNTSTPHTFTTDLAASIDMQFGGPGIGGPLWSQLVELMDVDAIMTFGQRVTFSIRPIIVPGTPFAFDGGEIFEYDGPGIATRFLHHGGLTFDTALDVMATFNVPHENIDALEAVCVPEPGSLMLVLLGLTAAAIRVRRAG